MLAAGHRTNAGSLFSTGRSGSLRRRGTGEGHDGAGEGRGVSAPALYRYFPTKKDLFLEILKLSGERLAEIWTRIIDDGPIPSRRWSEYRSLTASTRGAGLR